MRCRSASIVCTAVNPLDRRLADLPVERSRTATASSRRQRSRCRSAARSAAGSSTRYAADGIDWPYSDEVTAGVERQIGDSMRLGAMFYYRTNRDQLGDAQRRACRRARTRHSRSTSPNGPNGATTVTVYNLASALVSASNIDARQPAGARHRVQGRRVHRVEALLEQLADGGGIDDWSEQRRPGRRRSQRPEQPDVLPDGIIGNDSKVGFRLSGSYRLPYEIASGGFGGVEQRLSVRVDLQHHAGDRGAAGVSS